MAKVTKRYRASICISKLDTSMVKKGKDGKDYLNVNIVLFDEPNQYGSIGMIEVYVPKEQKQDDKNYIVGNLKDFEQKQEQPTQTQTSSINWFK